MIGGVRWLALVVWSGCGRVAFDDTFCESAVGHDEDRDGIDDACDGCPHVADPTQRDDDGDTVGNACDPNPTIPRERIAFFDPFTTMRDEWEFFLTPVEFTGDAISQDLSNGTIYAQNRIAPLQVGFYQIAGRIAPAGTRDRNHGILVYDGQASHGCILYDAGVSQFVLNHSYDNMTFSVLEAVYAQTLSEGEFVVTMRESLPMASCSTTWPADASELASTIPGNFVPNRFAFHLKGGIVTLDYFIAIATE